MLKANFPTLLLLKKTSQKSKKSFVNVLSLMIVTSLVETFALAATLPLFSILITPDLFLTKFSKYLPLYFVNLNNLDLTLLLAFVFTIITLLSMVLRWKLLSVQATFSHSLGSEISNKIFTNIMYMEYKDHSFINSSDMIAALTHKVNSVITFSILPVFSIANNIILILFISSSLMIINPTITILSAFLFIAMYGVLILSTQKTLSTHGSNANELNSKQIRLIQESLGSIRDVIISGQQGIYCKEFSLIDKFLRLSYSNILLISNTPRIIIESSIILLLCWLGIYGIYTETNIINNLPVLGLFAAVTQKLIPLFQQIYTGFSSISSGRPALIEVLGLMVDKNNTIPNITQNKLKFENTINFSNVNFKYPNKNKFILKNTNILINKGDIIGVVGPSGSGKSTFIDILLGLHLPSTGAIIVDDVKIDDTNVHNWRKSFSHVSQTIFLKDSSILENIAFIDNTNEIDLDKAINCAKLALIHDDIINFDHGYNTKVGERGVSLSGGQRQRIGIARALYRQSEIIVFDEATSALDNYTEEQVMNSIYSLSKNLTVIIVAHRLTTLKKCKKIIKIGSSGIKYIDISDL